MTITQEQLQECIDEGLSYQRIAERLGVSKGMIQNHMKKYGLTTKLGSLFQENQELLKVGKKHCPNCDQTKLLEDFKIDKGAGDGRTGWCRECENERLRVLKRERRRNNPERAKGIEREENRKRIDKHREEGTLEYKRFRDKIRMYGMKDDSLIEEKYQIWICESCSNPLTKETRVIDHDHTTNAYRGILCRPCNNALGYYLENPILLSNASSYLRERNKWEAPMLIDPIGYQERCLYCQKSLKYHPTRRFCPNYCAIKAISIRGFGISIAQFLWMRENQKSRCAICDTPILAKAECIDHCHTSGKVRGLLCHNCNFGLGHLDYFPERIHHLIEYLGASSI